MRCLRDKIPLVILKKTITMLGIRHVQITMLFLANIICYASRNNLNLALIAMTDKSSEQHFDIDLKIQSTLQSSLFWGYFVGIFPAGVLTTRYGGRRFIMLSLVVNSAASLALPFCRFLGPDGWKMIYGCRIVQGIFQAFLAPSCLTLMSKWVPEEERSRLGSFTYSGIQLGNAFQLITSGYLAEYWGWPSIFYFYTIVGVSWLLIYLFVGAESPAESKIISKEERNYIQTSLGYRYRTEKLKVPWKAIVSSMPFVATIMTYCGFKWGFYTLITQIPNYMKQIHGMNLRENGTLSALPYLALIGFLGPAAWLVALAVAAPPDKALAVAFLTLAVASISGIYSGFIVNQIDMAPNFTGFMNGFSNVFANLMSIFAPIAAGFMLGDGTDIEKWHSVFYLAVGIYVGTCAFYLVFADSRRQPWNYPDYKNKSNLT
ncbi:unnamed protein product [Leptosia nina]|uniref:Major facilitator superfamily (MFS) profile domain-containing protein n=1 Tax=Leptosia nina TaxID=320188 RepID=A0AAV1JTU4_9NEOP